MKSSHTLREEIVESLGSTGEVLSEVDELESAKRTTFFNEWFNSLIPVLRCVVVSKLTSVDDCEFETLKIAIAATYKWWIVVRHADGMEKLCILV